MSSKGDGTGAAAGEDLAWLEEAAARQAARFGEKAAALARAAAAGLRVPRGFVATAGAPEAVVLAAYDELGGGPAAVRTSGHGHGDGALGVVGRAAVAAAWRRVQVPVPVPVIVQRAMSPAVLRGVLRVRNARRPGTAWIEALDGAAATGDVAALLGAVPRGAELDLAPGAPHAVAHWGAALPAALVAALAAAAPLCGPDADVHWLWDGEALWIVGVHVPPPLAEDGTYLLDGEHNPVPLTPAMESLIRDLDARRRLPFRMIVHEGWLYAAGVAPPLALPSAVSIPPPAPVPAPAAAPAAVPAPPAASPTIEDALAALQGDLAGLDDRALANEVERRLGDFAAFADLYFATAAAARAERDAAALPVALLAGVGGAGPERDTGLAGAPLAEVLNRWGAFASGWDLAAPTYAEEPSPLAEAAKALDAAALQARRAAARAGAGGAAESIVSSLPSQRRPAMRRQIAAARAAAAALEADDLDFARALAALRAPLVELGRRLAARGDLARADDVFFLALREAAEAVRAAPGTLVLPPRVAAARARWVERRLHPPAPELRGGVPHWPALTHAPTPAPAALPRTLVGVGASPGWAQGRACVLYAPGRAGALPPGAVLVVPAATPACSFLLPQAVALVTEHGGALSHAAILAREYGLPAVVAVPDALRAIPDGARLEVDGTRGTVTLID